MTFTMDEVVPGVHRLGWAIGAKPMAVYLIDGPFVTLVDTGVAETPEAIYLPALERLGRRPEDVRLAIVTHADADHVGGNASAARLFPNLLLAAHRADAAMVADPATIMRDRYDAFAPYGLRYDDAVFTMLAGWMGPARPLDIVLAGDERLRLLADEWFDVVHVPGHTAGHIALVNRTRRYAIAGDVCFGRSQLAVDGSRAAPPPYITAAGYLATLRTLADLHLETLLTCHYPTLRGAGIYRFLSESRAWVEEADTLIRRLLDEAGPGGLTLGEAIVRADAILGPYAFARDLQFALLAHLETAVARNDARQVATGGVIGWRANGATASPT